MNNLKTILWITRTEFKSFFYTPIAWLILILFAAQTGFVFADVMQSIVGRQELNYPLGFITSEVFTGRSGVFPSVQKYIYLYIPLLTMGMMSREYSSGSVKLLYSSPVRPSQIVLGKYIAVLMMAGMMILLLVMQLLFAWSKIEALDIPLVLTGLLGIFLLIAAYSAIGLFMSCLTMYQMVAAIGTLAVLALLNFLSQMGQSIDIIRDLTYWLSLTGRTEHFIRGILLTTDILYFILMIIMFVMWSMIKLETDRQHISTIKVVFRYTSVLVICVFLGYFSARPQWIGYYDATREKSNTLTQASQDIISSIDGPLQITTYTNLLDGDYNTALPVSRNRDLARFDQYIYAKPDIRMNYVYYSTPTHNPGLDRRFPELTPEERAKELAKVHKLNLSMFQPLDQIEAASELEEEGYRFIRVVEQLNSGQKVRLRLFDDATRHPSEAEISVVLKRMVLDMPKVGFLKGYGGRDSQRDGDAHYNRFAREKNFRYSLVNQGFDAADVMLDTPIPGEITILVIADIRQDLKSDERLHLQNFIERGGNLLIAGEPEYASKYLNPILETVGIRFAEETLFQPNDDYSADLIQSEPTETLMELSYHFEFMSYAPRVITMPGATTLQYQVRDSSTLIQPILSASPGTSWLGDTTSRHVTGVVLERIHAGQQQRIVVLSDADCMSNAEISMRRKGVRSSNFILVTGLFHWLSDGLAPLDTRRTPSIDTKIALSQSNMDSWENLFRYILPLSLVFSAAALLIYRKRL